MGGTVRRMCVTRVKVDGFSDAALGLSVCVGKIIRYWVIGQ